MCLALACSLKDVRYPDGSYRRHAYIVQGIRQTCDGVIHGSQGLPGESTLLPERMPEVAAVPAMEEIYVGLTDGDVSGGCVCV